MKRKTIWLLVLIFVIAIIVRFYSFKESIYFGFDQARDSFISQDIYKKGDLKLIGPPVSGEIGLFHGPLFWYLLGPINLLFKGDPFFVSAVFRIINALGVFLVFVIGQNLFSPAVGLIASLLFAVSFEQSQYSIYVGNPTWGVFTTLLIFLGASLLYKRDSNKVRGLYLMLGGAALAVQLNLMFAYIFVTVFSLILLFFGEIKKIPIKQWLTAVGITVLFLSSFLWAEVKDQFRTLRTVPILLQKGFTLTGDKQSKFSVYFDKYLSMFRDNGLGLISNHFLLLGLVILITTIVAYKSIKNKNYVILLLWVLSWIFLMGFGGHNAYYTNAGLGIGVIVVFAVIVNFFYKKSKFLGIILGLFLIAANLKLVAKQSPNSLIVELTPQPLMKLADECRLIDEMYKEANGNGFTVRLTGIPYGVQTVWAYLFNRYGLPKWGYLPFWENGNIDAFPGKLPVPVQGTTCLRFRVIEPQRGLPQLLIVHDQIEEDYFSKPVKNKVVGQFFLETRTALAKDCHNLKP